MPWLVLLLMVTVGKTSTQVQPSKGLISQLTPHVWIYQGNLKLTNGKSFSYNGSLIISGKDVALIDLPASQQDFEHLMRWINQHELVLQYAVPLHWHHDSSGTINEAKQAGATIIALQATADILKPEKKTPDILFNKELLIDLNGLYIKLKHHGGGHTIDSVVAWVEEDQTLIAGCLIKGLSFNHLGNIDDAQMGQYAQTINSLIDEYPSVHWVVPGHGAAGNKSLLTHNLQMVMDWHKSH